MRTVLCTAVVVLALGACGDSQDSLAPGAGNDPGTGTGTLAIDGVVVASARRFNASTSTDFATEFSLRVSRGDQVISNGAVAVTSATGKTPLTYQSGRWIGVAEAYDEVYVLDIATGADRIDGVRIDGPDIHVFSHPPAGSTIPLTTPVIVAWNRDDEADAAAVRTESTDWIDIPDTGTYTMPARAFRPDTRQPRTHTVRLARTNRVAPIGATEGSSWSVKIENRLNLNTDAQPPL